MRTLRARAAAGVALALTTLVATLATPSSADAAGAFDTAPAAASLGRLLPQHAAQFTFDAVARPATGDYFAVSGTAGAVKVQGTSPAVLLTGVNWYLKYVAKVDLGWPGDSLSRLPATLPAPTGTLRQDAVVPHRFALNDTDDGYSGAYRDWAALERQIDLLALHGANEVLVQTGTDAAYYATLQEFGYTKAELQEWIPGPAHQPWWLLQNMSGIAGPITEAQLTARAALGKKIVNRVKELGMTPVLPGYFGTVPTDFSTRNGGVNVVAQGDWQKVTRPSWLDPRSSVYAQVAARFYAHQRTLLGDSTMYKMELLHEGGKPGNVPVGDAARGVFTALDTARPGATWVLLGWLSNPQAAILDNVDHNRLFIVDGLSDRKLDTNREVSFKGVPYAFGTIPNFGGHTTIGANTGVWATRFNEWRTKPGSALKGIAYMPEGTGTDPATFELFMELAWRTGPLDQTAWFTAYAARRYGTTDPHAAAAWDLLRQGPYSMPAGDSSESQDSLFAARPSLTVFSAAAFSPTGMRYNSATVQRALTELLAVPAAQRTTDAYRYDAVHLARQALANRSRVLLPQLRAAYDARDLAKFRQLRTEWSGDLALLDQLLGSDKRFLLGTWLAGSTATAAAEYDARSIITTWGPRIASTDGYLRDYANRELSGLVADFYAMRWDRYLDSVDAALVAGGSPAAIDWFAVEDTWNRERKTYTTTPTGDPYTLAAQVRDNLPAVAPAGPVIGASGRCADVTGGSSADRTALQIYDCTGAAAETWTAPGDKTLRAFGKCMDARDGATVPGTVVQLYRCNSTPAQGWTWQADKTLRNTKSGLCLDTEGAGTVNQTRLLLQTCTASASQRWNVPA
ncbi:alpha-N-acetylglucosaminidase TIM-barrel domain-containing protein [Longispora sp. NPDC051575]|uniref:alpha-N-acetylglucosaminidase n=1 Tax=Longispora sp. NPDC051575 TaxID=3154943 RepID=UPI00343C04E9